MENHERRFAASRVAGLVVCTALVLFPPKGVVRGAPLDHLLAGRVSGGDAPDGSYIATLTAAIEGLDGTGCRIIGKPKLMLAPVTKELQDPVPEGHDGSVPSLSLDLADPGQRYLCYKVRCPGDGNKALSARDQFGEQQSLVFRRSGRMLCAPAVAGPLPPCGAAGMLQCNGTCPFEGDTCVFTTAGCKCVPPPGCGKDTEIGMCESGNCPAGYVCSMALAEGACACLPAPTPTPSPTPQPPCETVTAPECGGSCSAGGVCADVGGGECGCILACGALTAQCSEGACPPPAICQPDGDGCRCE